MQCPYCGNEMEPGIIASAEPINWLKEKHFVNQPKTENGEFVLAKAGMIKRASLDAWLCRGCRKIIIDC